MINRRVRIRAGLHMLFLPFFDALCEKLPQEWQPYSGVRSFKSQDMLYAQGRTSPGGIITNAKGGESPHNYGLACDWTLWTMDGEPDWRKKEDLCWQELIDTVVSLGLRSGAEFGDVDHCELRIAVPWTTIHRVWIDRGPASAYGAIQAAMTPLV